MSTAVASRPTTMAQALAAPPTPLVKTTCIGPSQAVHVPAWVRDLASFRRWTTSQEFPDKARVLYLRGEIWMDLTMEQAFSHNGVKVELTVVLSPLAKADDFGIYFTDGMQLSNVPADLSAGPDGMLVTYATLESGRARLVPGKVQGFVEVEGSPDMVAEIVSDSSEEKDMKVLRELYWQAGIAEYWLIDARGEEAALEILRRGENGFIATRKRDGWIKSSVFGKSFKLTRTVSKHGHPRFTLHVK